MTVICTAAKDASTGKQQLIQTDWRAHLLSSDHSKALRISIWRSRGREARQSGLDWAVFLRPSQHRGDGFYRSKDPTNSIKVLKEEATKENLEKSHLSDWWLV